MAFGNRESSGGQSGWGGGIAPVNPTSDVGRHEETIPFDPEAPANGGITREELEERMKGEGPDDLAWPGSDT